MTIEDPPFRPRWRSPLPLRAWRDPAPVVPVLRLTGVIGNLGALRRGLTLEALAPAIARAFAVRHARAVALVVNSPGGSPVQSRLICARIRDLAAEKKLPVLSFVEDAAASGGYWLALAGDEIFVDESSIVGSIGVISAGFGFTGLMRRLGVERRVHSAGARKAMLDPFRAEKPDDVERLTALQRDIHGAFIRAVRDRRGERLRETDADLFSGEFWAGRRAVELGLADGLGEMRAVLRDRFGERVRLREATRPPPWWRRRLGLSRAPAAWAGELLDTIEERAAWTRLGL